jgi:hypothetical protein
VGKALGHRIDQGTAGQEGFDHVDDDLVALILGDARDLPH